VKNKVLRATQLGKLYRLYAKPMDRLLAMLGLAERATLHWALKDVGFELVQGQCLGVVGDNGAGKSTLLKLLAGTIRPSQGSLQRQGRITAILELGAGFHPDFTGRENLEYGASYIGIETRQLQALVPQIIAFSELGEAIDRPVKTYSSGMVVRLAFALVTAVQPEVLIIDEALAVGDQHFQKKCVQRIQEFRSNGCTVLFCSHSMYHVRQLCDTVLWLDAGSVRSHGETEAVLAKYELHARLKESKLKEAVQGMQDAEDGSAFSTTTPAQLLAGVAGSGHAASASAQARIMGVQVLGLEAGGGVGSGAAEESPELTGADLCIEVCAVAAGAEPPSFGVMLEQHRGVGITSLATHAEGVVPRRHTLANGELGWAVTLRFPDFPLHSGEYVLSFYLFDAQGLVIFDEWKDYLRFQWVSPSLTPGLVRLPHTWA
jgi:lipopolysaccharide transport system ATP-binding protein